MKIWYCYTCRDFTKQKPKYNTDYLSRKYLAEYKCSVCGEENRLDTYGCPNCGAESNEDTWVSSTDPEYNLAQSMNYGTCYDWEETHKCWNCDTIYEYENSNC